VLVSVVSVHSMSLSVVVQTVLHVLGDGGPDRLLHRVRRGVWRRHNRRRHDDHQ